MNKPGSKHLSYEERSVIEKLISQGYSQRKIAGILCRSPNTISKELGRNKVKNEYLAKKAKQKSCLRRHMSKWQSFKALKYENFIQEKLKRHWSPEVISGELKKYGVAISPKAVYKFCHSRCLDQYLLGKRKRKQRKTSYLGDQRKFIENRPELAGFCHYEADFIVCSQNTFSLLVLVEKHSKLTLACLIPDKKKQTLFSVFENIVSRVKIETITTDNDIAFSCWRELEQRYGFQIFFTHPYRSWEKPLVEQTNKLIRQFAPKGMNLRLVSRRKLSEINQFLNHRPRQCLNFLTAYEKYQSQQ